MEVEHVDVLIVGAGLSGVGAACHLQTDCPGKTYAIFEARDRIGGTWDLFRYPGIRSDSDMHTLGYRFRPWRQAKSIADGESILSYIRDTARENGVEGRIRFNHRVVRADWRAADAAWHVEARTSGGDTVRISCGFLFMCSGYYRYDEGYTPEFRGTDRFTGWIVHPQHWPEDIEYDGKRVVVIGSGATAVTLVPALAEHAAHVTMLQRSPSYIVSLPADDPVARVARRVLPARLAYAIVRWKNVLLTLLSFQLSRRRPEMMKSLIRRGVESQLPIGFDIDTHFTPRYNPWDQRLCLVPNGDLFQAISEGRVTVCTAEVDTFTERGLKLTAGRELEADLIITATGLNLLPLGGLELSLEGEPVDIARTVGYKGMMLCGVPNMAVAFGYTNASWTLKCDLTCGYVCRLLSHMDASGHSWCVPQEPPSSVAREPFIDFSSGYVTRSIDRFPKQGATAPWRLYQNYALDIITLRFGSLDDGTIQFGGQARTGRLREPIAA